MTLSSEAIDKVGTTIVCSSTMEVPTAVVALIWCVSIAVVIFSFAHAYQIYASWKSE